MIPLNNLVNIEKKYPIIIKPNLGIPSIINLIEHGDKTELESREILIEMYILGDRETTPEQIRTQITNNVYLQPILKDSGEFEQRRGEKYPLKIQEILKKEIEKFRRKQLQQKEHPTQEVCELWDLFQTIKKKGFKDRTQLFKIVVKLEHGSDLYEIMKKGKKECLLCDLIQIFPELKKIRRNFHAIALFNKDWKNFRFIHATDTHIARRNDFIAKFLKKRAKNKRETGNDKNQKTRSFILDREFKFNQEFQEKKLERFRHGKFNFNDNLRKFISYVNEKEKENSLDIVVFTGDLIDYVNPANKDKYYENNFQFLLDILVGLDRDPELREEGQNKKEILVPIFTIIGNHDYRRSFYSIKTGRIYKKFGLKRKEIRKYSDDKPFRYLRALYSRTKFLNNYLLLFNPLLNFMVNFSEKYSLICLDTGMDSIANLFDLMKSAPSTRGLKKFQIKVLKAFIHQAKNKHIVVFMHAPPLSPNFGGIKKWRLKRKFGLNRKIQWADFYEQNITKYQDTKRLETILYFKYQTIMYRWATLMKILVGTDEDMDIQKKVDLVLCGHTHTLKEFRIEKAEKSERKKVLFWFYFIPIYINTPCKIFTSRYRDIIKKFEDKNQLKMWFEEKKPFIFHTQGLGPLSSKFKVKSPGFRLITVENNQICNIQVYSLQLENNEKKIR
jgi:3',5'-cyclic AMP phosphodiesterase CpdA